MDVGHTLLYSRFIPNFVLKDHSGQDHIWSLRWNPVQQHVRQSSYISAISLSCIFSFLFVSIFILFWGHPGCVQGLFQSLCSGITYYWQCLRNFWDAGEWKLSNGKLSLWSYFRFLIYNI